MTVRTKGLCMKTSHGLQKLALTSLLAISPSFVAAEVDKEIAQNSFSGKRKTSNTQYSDAPKDANLEDLEARLAQITSTLAELKNEAKPSSSVEASAASSVESFSESSLADSSSSITSEQRDSIVSKNVRGTFEGKVAPNHQLSPDACGFFFTVDFLYWQANEDNLEPFARFKGFGQPTPDSLHPNSKIHFCQGSIGNSMI
jgi:hypothetical protein